MKIHVLWLGNKVLKLYSLRLLWKFGSLECFLTFCFLFIQMSHWIVFHICDLTIGCHCLFKKNRNWLFLSIYFSHPGWLQKVMSIVNLGPSFSLQEMLFLHTKYIYIYIIWIHLQLHLFFFSLFPGKQIIKIYNKPT